MRTNSVRFAAGLALLAACAPGSALGQFIYPPVLIVPPPPDNYGTPKPASKPPPDKPKPAEPPAQAKPAGHYEGRTFVPD
jgi:hypothetical protein